MASLYGLLFRYRAREHRAPLEDFLTEALSDLLQRLPAKLANGFIRDLLVTDVAARAAWPAVPPDTNLRVRSQHHITRPRRGIIDLLIEDDAGRPLIVVESKIFSPLRSHLGRLDKAEAPHPEAEDAKVRNQLTTYEEWLALSRHGMSWSGAVVLLSHGTPPPEDFLQAKGRPSGAPVRAVLSWRDVARWLQCAADHSDGGDARGWRILAIELVHFLTENGMNADVIGPTDLAAMQIFMPGYPRVKATFERLSKRIGESNKAFGRSRELNLDGEGGVYWEWCYPKPPHTREGSSWYISWGLRFPEGSTWWLDASPKLPSRPHASVSVGTENQPLSLTVTALEGWSKTDGEAILAQPLSDFPHKSEEFVSALEAWIAQRAQEALMILKSMTEEHLL